VLLSYVEVLPLELFDAVPPEPPCAELLFVLDEFPEFVNVELPLFFTADDPPVLVAEPPVAILVELPPVAAEVLEELLLEFDVELDEADCVCD
jgi:hypothetical protein